LPLELPESQMIHCRRGTNEYEGKKIMIKHHPTTLSVIHDSETVKGLFLNRIITS